MTKILKNIIKEELQKFFESLADKYAERAFNIPDPSAEKEKIAISGMKNLPQDANKENLMGIFVGNVKDVDKSYDTNIYLNPKSLKDFERNVKAVSTENGDIFVAQLDAGFNHQDMIKAANSGGVYRGGGLWNAYDEEHNITWHRIENTNDFGFSVSYKDFMEDPQNELLIEKHLQVVKQKNPNFNFIPKYWHYIKLERSGSFQSATTPPLKNIPIYSNK
jgi:hypothetical protein